MEAPKTFTVPIFPGDKSVLVTTLNPTGKFYYQLTTPTDLYWGLFCGQIAFYDYSGNLIYHKQNQLAQFDFTGSNVCKIVSWSRSGSLAHFIERNSVSECWHVLLDLEQKQVCKIPFEDSDAGIFQKIRKNYFNDNEVKHNSLFEFSEFKPEKVKKRLREYFGFSRWRPK